MKIEIDTGKPSFIACPMSVNISLKQRVGKVKEKQLLGNEQEK